jgi:hypothetical protein
VPWHSLIAFIKISLTAAATVVGYRMNTTRFTATDDRSPDWLFINPEDPAYPPEIAQLSLRFPTMEEFNLLMSYVTVLNDEVVCG